MLGFFSSKKDFQPTHNLKILQKNIEGYARAFLNDELFQVALYGLAGTPLTFMLIVGKTLGDIITRKPKPINTINQAMAKLHHLDSSQLNLFVEALLKRTSTNTFLSGTISSNLFSNASNRLWKMLVQFRTMYTREERLAINKAKKQKILEISNDILRQNPNIKKEIAITLKDDESQNVENLAKQQFAREFPQLEADAIKVLICAIKEYMTNNRNAGKKMQQHILDVINSMDLPEIENAPKLSFTYR